jgi:hypothetical protein
MNPQKSGRLKETSIFDSNFIIEIFKVIPLVDFKSKSKAA